MVNLRVDGRRAKFKIDSGADVTVIPNKIFNQIYGNNVPKLPKATRMCSTGCSKCFENRKRKKMKQEQAGVTKNLYTALIGRRAITKLELVSRVHSPASGYTEKVIPKTEWWSWSGAETLHY